MRLREEAKLYSICQRYNFESNLQQDFARFRSVDCCIRYVKDTILKAIYNYPILNISNAKLYSICQRYNFESNLQHSVTVGKMKNGCIRYVKDTILKAIYNCVCFRFYRGYAVFDMSKIQF